MSAPTAEYRAAMLRTTNDDLVGMMERHRHERGAEVAGMLSLVCLALAYDLEALAARLERDR